MALELGAAVLDRELELRLEVSSCPIPPSELRLRDASIAEDPDQRVHVVRAVEQCHRAVVGEERRLGVALHPRDVPALRHEEAEVSTVELRFGEIEQHDRGAGVADRPDG